MSSTPAPGPDGTAAPAARLSAARRVVGVAKRVYVAGAHGLGRAARGVGLLSGPVPRRGSAAHHVRSLVAIYDLDRLAELDVPWWTYPATEAVERHLASLGGTARVLEYGSGASTLWLAARSGHVHSVEHDDDWARRVSALLDRDPALAARVHLEVVRPEPSGAPRVGSVVAPGLDFAEYVAAVERATGPWDLVVVDGRARAECLLAAAGHLAEGGVLLLDDAQRSRYDDAVRRSGLQVTRHRGLAPTLPLPRQTALLRAHASPAAR
ncbi:class I SAM-dependent methyltransferase [Thalassiella azotivora]